MEMPYLKGGSMMLEVAPWELEMLTGKMGRTVVAAGWLSDLSTGMLWVVVAVVIVEIVIVEIVMVFVGSWAAGVMSY